MLAHGVLLFVASVAGIVRAGNTTCKTTSLDWFTQSVGETPCRTYERLRQVCSADYQVGNFRSTTPGDNCSGQPAICCCNSVAWALSMLCMNCQYGVGSSVNGDSGYDAGAGAYGIYLNNCGRPTNKTLPDTVQTAVCRQDIKIPSFVYNLFWVTGDWYYEYSKGSAQLDISSGKNDTGLCPKASSSSSTVSATESIIPTSQPTSSESNVPVGAIAGGVVGGVVALAAAVLLGFFISRRRKGRRGVIDLTEENKSPSVDFEPYSMPPGAIAQPVPITPYAAPSTSDLASTAGSPPPTQASSRPSKPGLIAPSPPNRAEIYQSQPLLPTDAGSSSHITDRHEDSEVLSSTFGLGRSVSGRLPPSYQERS
ncbi:hypothetical protein RSOLAG22IIIB_05067 [Rhizoctonia solani]|uniref:Uncharacterized protein n=1 Tax=Rhizoctonia solani TaxID=456999 RepID=A0A0K6G3D8_9AGAM|nr:hypothetical protein RSOLAG22IIIB_05067 [Rhizoctonia solani]